MLRRLCFAIGVVACLGVAVGADHAPDTKTGVKVGEKAPAFKLKDQSGQERELSTLLKDGPVALVFYRSASW